MFIEKFNKLFNEWSKLYSEYLDYMEYYCAPCPESLLIRIERKLYELSRLGITETELINWFFLDEKNQEEYLSVYMDWIS